MKVIFKTSWKRGEQTKRILFFVLLQHHLLHHFFCPATGDGRMSCSLPLPNDFLWIHARSVSSNLAVGSLTSDKLLPWVSLPLKEEGLGRQQTKPGQTSASALLSAGVCDKGNSCTKGKGRERSWGRGEIRRSCCAIDHGEQTCRCASS